MTAAAPVLTRAAIVAVGSELLETTKIDTNSLFITEQLNGAGIDVVSKHIAGDDRAVLTHVLRSALSKLFREENDIKQVIKLRTIYELLERITDRCEDVANVVEGIVLENS